MYESFFRNKMFQDANGRIFSEWEHSYIREIFFSKHSHYIPYLYWHIYTTLQRQNDYAGQMMGTMGKGQVQNFKMI